MSQVVWQVLSRPVELVYRAQPLFVRAFSRTHSCRAGFLSLAIAIFAACAAAQGTPSASDSAVPNLGERKFVEGQPITWSEVESVLASWAQDFKARLNVVQGR